MSITVKFFASIREALGRSEDTLDFKGISCVADVWKTVTPAPLPPNTVVAVNQEYAALDQIVRDGDEVAFFPPVTGG